MLNDTTLIGIYRSHLSSRTAQSDNPSCSILSKPASPFRLLVLLSEVLGTFSNLVRTIFDTASDVLQRVADGLAGVTRDTLLDPTSR